MASPFDAKHNQVRSRIIYYANRYGIPENVGIWQIWQESKFNPTVCSHANACGIAQFIPATAQRYGVNRNNVESSLDGWGRYMRDLLRMFNGRVDIALAGYNSGENRAEYRNAAAQNRPINWSIMPAGVKSETQNYVKTIMRQAGESPVNQISIEPNPASGNVEPDAVGIIASDDDTWLWWLLIGAAILAL